MFDCCYSRLSVCLAQELLQILSRFLTLGGRRIATAEDYLLKQALAFMEGANLIIPGAYWFETIPALVKLPSWIYPTAAPITKGMRGVKRYFRDLANEGAQSQEPCFSKVLVQDQKKLGLSDDEVSDLTALLVGGGVDTTCALMKATRMVLY